jgi:RNA polymerase sigma-70 factor (ECF subfamily)
MSKRLAASGVAEASFAMTEEAFRAFYDRTSRSVWGYLARMTGDPSMADDLLQDTYYRFLRASATHESEAHRRNALFTIRDQPGARCLSPAQRASLLRHATVRDSVRAKTRPAASNARRTCLAPWPRCGHATRAMLWLAYVEGFSHREIATGARDQDGEHQITPLPRAPPAGRRPARRTCQGRPVMKRVECPFEDDVLMYVGTGRWPDRAPAELTAHARFVWRCAVTSPSSPARWIPSEATCRCRRAFRAPARCGGTRSCARVKTPRKRWAARSPSRKPRCSPPAVAPRGAVFGATTGWFQRALSAVVETTRSVAASVHLPTLPAVSFRPDHVRRHLWPEPDDRRHRHRRRVGRSSPGRSERAKSDSRAVAPAAVELR